MYVLQEKQAQMYACNMINVLIVCTFPISEEKQGARGQRNSVRAHWCVLLPLYKGGTY